MPSDGFGILTKPQTSVSQDQRPVGWSSVRLDFFQVLRKVDYTVTLVAGSTVGSTVASGVGLGAVGMRARPARA